MRRDKSGKSGLTFVVGLAAVAVFFSFCRVPSTWAAEEGLVAYYDFNEGSGKTAHDKSGNKNDGKIHGASYVKTKSGYALKFKQGNYVDCGNSPTLKFGTRSFTIEAWINCEEMTYPYIINNYDGKHYLLYMKESKIRLHVDDGKRDPEVTSGNASFQAGVWYHIVAVRDAGKSLRMYVNGEQKGTVGDAAGDITSLNPLVIGKSARDNGHPFEGIIDEVRIYNRALSEATVRGHYQEEKGNFPQGKKAPRTGYEPPTKRWSSARVFIKNGPWTPMSVKNVNYKGASGVEISCWGRRYIFTSASVFPTQIISQNKELLLSPVELRIDNISPAPATITPSLPEVTIGPFSGDDERVVFTSKSKGKDLALEARITLEFDGYMWMDVSLTGGGAIGKALLNIPMVSSSARYYNFGESGWRLERAGVIGGDRWGWSSIKGARRGYVDEAGEWAPAGAKGGRGGWEPIVSLCSDETGLSWFADDYKGWQGNKEIRILHQGERVSLQASVVGKKAPLPVRFSFGLQAVPLKPLPNWHWSGKRFFHATPIEQLDEVGKGFVNFPHFGCKPYFSYIPNADEPKLFHDFLAAYHARGCRVIHYLTTHYMTESAPGFQSSWEVRPRKRLGPYGGHMVAGVCPNSNWRHFWVDNIVKKTLELYPELDGLYFDCATPMGCARTSHGCAPYSFQWRAEREMFKKAYVMVKSRSQEKIVQLHSSGFRWVTPCLSFVDVRLSGEYLDHNVDNADNQYHAKRKQPYFPANEMNLAKFRSCMQPHSWGIPMTFLAYDRDAYINAILRKGLKADPKTGVKGDPTTRMGHRFGDPEEAAAWCSVHDISIQTTVKDHFGYAGFPHTCFIMRDIWDILEKFGATYDTWHGYWYELPLATVTGASLVKVSGYVKKGKETLLVIANLSPQKAKATITLNCNVLGLRANKLEITDAGKGDWLVHERVSHRGNTISIPMAGAKSKGSLRFLKVR